MDYRQWLEFRKRGIGSSDSPVLWLGEVFGKTPVDLYIEKRTPVPLVIEQSDNPNFRRGHTYEPLAARLWAERSGIAVHIPADDAERYGPLYCVPVPGRPIYADFDGFCADGWVLEVKSPLQRVADRMRTEGVRDYYLVQSAHLGWVANQMGTLCSAPGACPGVRLLVYEPENIDVQCVEIPYDAEFSDRVIAEDERFWAEHVLTGQPPARALPRQVPKRAKGESTYTAVDGEAWRDVAARFRLAKDAAAASEARLAAAKATIAEAMVAAGLDKVLTPDGQKWSYAEQAGRKNIDTKLLRHEHPEIDWARYEKQGEPFRAFLSYGAKDAGGGDEALDRQIVGLGGELGAFAETVGGDDTEIAIPLWDDLRARTELYVRMLRAESEDLEQRLATAAAQLTKRLTGGL